MSSHHYLYLLIDFGCILFPLLLSFHPEIKFNRQFKYYFPANLIAASIFIAWDILFTYWGVWNFNPYYVTGLYFFNIPIEEVLFFICIPFACSFSYCVFEQKNWFLSSPIFKHIYSGIMAASAIAALLFYDRLYTLSTVIATVIILIQLKKNQVLFSKIVWVYLWMLIPFFISNGILTGAITPSPIVGYNDLENLGIRMYTIPVEDTFYGFSLFALTIILFEKLRKNEKSL